jgi:hypothetical protein
MSPTPLRFATRLCATGIFATSATAQSPCQAGHWVAAWSTAVHTPVAFPGAPPPLTHQQSDPPPGHPTHDLAGNCLRVRFSNEFGAPPRSSSATRTLLSPRQTAASSPAPTVLSPSNGKATVQIPAGAPMLS